MGCKMKKQKPKIRLFVQLFFFVLIALIAVGHSLAEKGIELPLIGTPSLHAVCPFGGVVTLYQLVSAGTFVQKIHPSSLILMFIVLGAAVILGPLFCGWICPLGTVQEWISRLGKKIFPKGFNRFIPAKWDKWLRFLRYGVLLWVLFMTAFTGKLLFAEVDPYYALFQFWTGEVAVSGLIILGLVLLASLFVERPFCKYACPYGAFLGLTNLFRVFSLKRNKTSCIDCKACDKACPMNIPVSTKQTIRDHQCISCYRCTSTDGVCPKENTVEFRIGPFKGVNHED